MLLESIKLKNFRQFQEETLEFATGDNGKNVTIIIGENGTGKTTFAQAFIWCMYGETEFTDKILLNRLTANALSPGEEATVYVELRLKHGEVPYILRREQVYRKGHTNNKVTVESTKFDVGKKKPSGTTEYLKKNMCEAEVKKILPKELASYFFFDGERIGNMSKDISAYKKSSDFSEAVEGLLGLHSVLSAIGHLNPRSKTSVIGIYENSYDSASNAQIQEYTRTIERCNDEINRATERIRELEEEIEAAKTLQDNRSKELKQYEDSKDAQETMERLIKEIDALKKMKASKFKDICKTFNGQLNFFFSANMMNRALELLTKQDIMGKDIPYMHVKTIEHLLKQGECICGTCLQEGTIPYRKVYDLMEYLPPKSLSTVISDFKTEALARTNITQDLQSSIEEDLQLISTWNDEIDDKRNEISVLEDQLAGENVGEKIRSIEREILDYKKTIKEDENYLIDEKANLKSAEKEKENADTKRGKLILLDQKNIKIEGYKAYAKRIHEELTKEYAVLEEEVRNKLQETINVIFKKIYEGGLSLAVDSKYHISIIDKNDGTPVNPSTAQSISAIFAFIAAIIKLARESKKSTYKDEQLLTSEPYPLVMDAPLSTFDKKRIKAVCEILPKVAEQIIIFIKDIDGEYAEKFMGNRIGSRHHFEKENEFKTQIV